MARATGGRAGRHLRRGQALPINPAPPGGGGGQYKPLSISDMEQIYEMALRLLEDLGVGEVPGRLRDPFVQQGARFEAGRIHIPRRLIAQAIASAPKPSRCTVGMLRAASKWAGIGCISVLAARQCRLWIWTAVTIAHRRFKTSMTLPGYRTN